MVPPSRSVSVFVCVSVLPAIPSRWTSFSQGAATQDALSRELGLPECSQHRAPKRNARRGMILNYLCSLGTKTELGNSTNGLFGVLLDDGPEN